MELKKENKILSVKCASEVNGLNKLLISTSHWKRLVLRYATFRLLANVLKSKDFKTNLDLRGAENAIWIYVQGQAFQQEVNQLKSGSKVTKVSKLCKFVPWVDQSGLIRIGG